MIMFLKLIGSILLPIVALICLVVRVSKLMEVIEKHREIEEKELKELKESKIIDFFPKRVERRLRTYEGIDQESISELIKEYKKSFRAIIIYYIFWIGYVSYIVLKITRIFNGYYKDLQPKEYGILIGSVLMSILIFYWFVLVPIFQFYGKYKMVKIGLLLWEFFNKIINVLSEKVIKLIVNFVVVCISLKAMYKYIWLIKYIIIEKDNNQLNFWMYIATLLVFQYLVLHIATWIISKIMNALATFCPKIKPVTDKYFQHYFLYEIFKNSTYLSMVLIYAQGMNTDKANHPLVLAITVVFLLDTFLKEEKNIKEKYEKNNLADENKRR